MHGTQEERNVTSGPTSEEFTNWIKDLPARLEPEHVGSAVMAPLFSHVLAHPARYEEGFALLRDKMIDLTVRMARENTSYYGKSLETAGHKFTGYEQLEELPLVTKESIYEHEYGIISDITTFGFVTFTTGTISQRPLLIQRSLEEQQYLQNFFSVLQSNRFESEASQPLGISEGSMNHGAVLKIPGFGYNFMVELIRDYGVLRTVWLLQNEFDFPGHQRKVSKLNITYMGLCVLYQYMEQENIRLPEDQLDAITIFGWPVPPKRKKAMEDFFGTGITDNFSMSEMFGGARYCDNCGGFHFEPFVVPEVLNVETGGRIDEGVGELVITPLFPFSQRFVLIRYKTSDLVKIYDTDCPAGKKAYKFKGRLQRSVKIAPGIYAGEAEVAKAIDDVPGLSRPSSGFSILNDPSAPNWPKFKINELHEDFKLGLTAELTFSPEEKPGLLKNTKKQIVKRLTQDLTSEVSSWLQTNTDALTIRLAAPDTLSERDYWNL
ncbi:hypothetical protein SAMN05443144_12813 [Fodinibius roseus]|uniref:Phenylacetate-coenzyme A ligase PaaK, adenylate-forming domain family n=1 Tax=Fodinibius roseus TaxID=1194090 RepID=A0A1M5JQ52_9BACT|nr:hypothetical protein [Fodinibius roseus]SHG42684.1 hypothetical protein SAMN05443144_12813 [Fodinibius roseus]